LAQVWLKSSHSGLDTLGSGLVAMKVDWVLVATACGPLGAALSTGVESGISGGRLAGALPRARMSPIAVAARLAAGRLPVPATTRLTRAVAPCRTRSTPHLRIQGATAVFGSLPGRVVAALSLAFGTFALRARRNRRRCPATLRDAVSRPTVTHGSPGAVLVVGGPGSGKGTLCARIAEEFGYRHLSAGELLRAECQREGSQLGGMIEETIRAGGMVPSAIVASLLERAMRDAGWAEASFVIDGYPRSAEQLEGWKEVLESRIRVLCCFHLDVGREVMRSRLLARAGSSGRADDEAATIERRFATFEAETGPVVGYFESRGLLVHVDGEQSADAVAADARRLLLRAMGESVSAAVPLEG